MKQAKDSSSDVMLEAPKTLADLLELLNGGFLKEGFVWRGQSNCMWPLFPSLYRRLRYHGFADSQINESLVRRAEALLIKHAQLESLLDEESGDCLELMAQIQHYGGATRLLDVTHNPLVALYFSLGDLSTTGVVHRWCIDPSCRVVIGNGSASWDDVLRKGEGGRPVLVCPPAWNRRMSVQSAAFITTVLANPLSETNIFTNETSSSKVLTIWIAPEMKFELREYLESKGINKRTLLPSIESFASRWACDKSFKNLIW